MHRMPFVFLYLSLLPGCFKHHEGCVDSKTFSKVIPINMDNLLDKDNIVPAVVIGSGPAGLSAGLYLGRANLKALIISGNKPGGQLTETSYVENWPGIKKRLGVDIMADLKDQAIAFGAEYLNDTVVKVDFSKWPFKIETENNKTIYAMSVVITTGASVRKLSAEGALEYWGKGVSACAICDAPFYKGLNVAVVGGGDSAIEEVTQLASSAEKIYLLVRKDALSAAPVMQKRISKLSNLEILFNTEIVKITGDDSSVRSIQVYNKKENKKFDLDVEGVFLAIGRNPNSKIFKDYLVLDDEGYIVVDCRNQQTSIKGIFAAGDVENRPYRQAGAAAGNGIIAGLASLEFLADIGFDADLEHKIQKKYFNLKKRAVTEVKSINSESELQNILDSEEKLVVLDFWAQYCPSCVKMLPIIEDMAEEFKDKVKFFKINIEKLPELVKTYSISHIPAIFIFKKNTLLYKESRSLTKDEFKSLITKFL